MTCCWTLRGRSEVNFLHNNNTENTLHIPSDGKSAANSVGVLQVYAAFGLGASLKKVLKFSNMLLYAEYVADNMEFPRDLPSIQDDMFQVERCSKLRVRKQMKLFTVKLIILDFYSEMFKITYGIFTRKVY